ncbi:hypothetical protein, variant [Aphanomyces invadans]|nr:hypothetical protein, variant [Aphanomyces invadans]ETW10454.1 hypothetical protein, variant [Aphanomyces invadans]|eukprot:XP_008861865.1 hypothetical protein, variant [Aphanomyces invadans]
MLFNAPKKSRDMMEQSPMPTKPQRRVAASTYTPKAQSPTARARTKAVSLVPSRTPRSGLAPRISVKPTIVAAKKVNSTSSAAATSRPNSASSASPSQTQPAPSSSTRHSTSTPLASLSFALQENKPQPPSSPLVRSANQEDKDDHVAFPSFPPPPNFQQLPARDPPGFNVHLVESTFRVIDIKRRGKLNVREIHQGLQLLGIATTLRQITDYLYLVTDGQGDTIDLQDWTTLVQTLQSSAWATPSFSLDYAPTALAPTDPAPTMPSQPAFPPTAQPRGMTARSLNHVEIETVATQCSPVHSTAASPQAPPRPFNGPATTPSSPWHETWFIDQIERRIQELFGRAEAAVALRWNNQQVDGDPPRDFLRRAASVVHGLKSSLYPLVQQAEETLRAIQDRHAGNLSVLLSPKDLEIVADHVDDFGDLLLDEVLLDAAIELTTTEQLKALHATQASHDEDVQQLITMIDDIQASEQAMAEALLRPLTTIQDDGDARVATTPCLVPICTLPQLSEPQAQCENVASRPALAIFTDEAQLCRRLTVCTNNIATIEETLEDHRQAFLRSRRIAEASLADTGIEQPAVIELLEGMLVDDLVDALAVELDSCFYTLSDKIVHTV